MCPKVADAVQIVLCIKRGVQHLLNIARRSVPVNNLVQEDRSGDRLGCRRGWNGGHYDLRDIWGERLDSEAYMSSPLHPSFRIGREADP